MASATLNDDRAASYIKHITHIQNIPNPNQIQYMNYTHSFAWTFNKDEKLKKEKDDPLTTPAPSTYQIKDNSIKSPAWTISDSKRVLADVKSTTPGAGNYEYKTFIGEGPKYTLRAKYNIDGTTDGKRSSKAYRKSSVPGPGHYEAVDNTGGPKYTIGVKHLRKVQSQKSIPGVGSYNLRKDNDFVAPSYIIDREIRYDLSINHSALKYPGPNKYDYDLKGSSSMAPKWSFSRSERFVRSKSQSALTRQSSVPSCPGPGSYNMPGYLGKEGPHYTFGKEKYCHADGCDISMAKETMKYPAPGTYLQNIKYVPNMPIYTIPKSKRKEPNDKTDVALVPGPGKYNPDKDQSSTINKNPIWTLNKSRRDQEEEVPGSKKKRIQTPGPGHYTFKNGIMPNGPQYSIAKRFKEKLENNNPGPGQYNSVSVHFPCEPKYSIANKCDNVKVKKKNQEEFPGPGNYTIHDSVLTKGISFPKDKRVKGKKVVYPGPGQYKIPTSFDYISEMTRQQGVFDPTFKYV